MNGSATELVRLSPRSAVMLTVNRNPTENDLRKFGRAMFIGFSTLAVLLWLGVWRKSGAALFTWTGTPGQWLSLGLIGLGVALFAASVAAPTLTKSVYVVWMTATVPIGIVMSTALLTILFVFVLPVFALIVRLGDPLRRRLGGATYWEDFRPHEPTLERMRRPF